MEWKRNAVQYLNRHSAAHARSSTSQWKRNRDGMIVLSDSDDDAVMDSSIAAAERAAYTEWLSGLDTKVTVATDVFGGRPGRGKINVKTELNRYIFETRAGNAYPSPVGGTVEVKMRDSESLPLMKDELERELLKYIRAAMRLPETTAFETPLQIIFYGKRGFFSAHHDAVNIDDDGNVLPDEPSPSFDGCSRLISGFLYLTDVQAVEGGETNFPRLQQSVRPQQYSLAFWPNVTADAQWDMDVVHRGNVFKPVSDRQKIGINFWVTSLTGRVRERPLIFERVSDVYSDEELQALLEIYRAKETAKRNNVKFVGEIERSGRIDVPLGIAPTPNADVSDVVADEMCHGTRLLGGARGLLVVENVEAQPWHADESSTLGPNYATLIVALEPVDYGMTEFALRRGSGEFVSTDEYQADPDMEFDVMRVTLEANEGILFDGRLLHRGGASPMARPPVVYQVFSAIGDVNVN